MTPDRSGTRSRTDRQGSSRSSDDDGEAVSRHRGGSILGSFLALLLVLFSLANGAPYFLGRTGLIAPEAYERDRQAFCPSAGPPAGLVSACPALRTRLGPSGHVDRLSLERLHAISPVGLPFKAARLALLVGLPLTALVAMFLGFCRWPRWRPLLPALPLVVSLSISLAISLLQAPLIALPQVLRSLAWLPLLVVPGPAASADVLSRLALGGGTLLLLQLPLMVVEAIRGLPMVFGPPADQLAQASLALPTRLVGSFVQPNSLGVAMVALLGFCICYLPQRRLLPLLALLALPPLLLARSGTGVLGWAVVLLYGSFRGRRLSRIAKLAGMLLVAGLIAVLPRLLARLDLWESLFGRVRILFDLVTGSQPSQLLFGQGLLTSSPTDSLPALLLLQSGAIGLLGFYGLLAWAWRCDDQARPFFLAVLIGSFTLTITELFPVNLLFALCMHHSLCGVGDDPSRRG